MLRWAREQSGLSREDAAKKVGVSSKKRSGADRVGEWEEGLSFPTQKQATALAKVYRRPLLTFFLAAPPSPAPKIADFRVLPGEVEQQHSDILSKLLRQVQACQAEVKEILLEDTDGATLDFIGKAASEASASKIASMIRRDLHIEIEQQLRCKKDELFKLIRSAAENTGIFIQLIGNLGNHHTNIPPDVFRGFAIADKVAPFIIINPNDAKRAHVFTLLHELGHLWLGEGGITNTDPFNTGAESSQTERICNAIAAEFLLPTPHVLHTWSESSSTNRDIRQTVSNIAEKFCVSHTAAAYRLYTLHKIDNRTWNTLRSEYYKHWEAAEKKRREDNKKKPNGPSYYVVKQHQIGKPLIYLVSNAIDSGDLTRIRAGRILGVNPLGIAPLREAAGE